MDLWRDEKLSLQRKETLEPGATTSMGSQVRFFLKNLPLAFIYLFKIFCLCLNICDIFQQAVNLLETEPELIFIKEEAYDEHPIGQQMSLSDNRKSMFDF